MRKILYLLIAAALLSAAPLPAQPGVPRGDRRVKVMVDNDFGGDPDGLFALAHQVLCESVNLRGIIGSTLGGPRAFGAQQGQDQGVISAKAAEDLLEAMDLAGKFKVAPGSSGIMTDPNVPLQAEGIQLIIDEARACTPERPLFVCVGGALTDIASALLLAPDIAPNMIVVWIGGQEYPFGHPKPWGGIDEREYNLRLDVPSVRTVFNQSDVRIWQVPRDAYRQCLYSFSSVDAHVRPLGKMGESLAESLGRWRRMNPGEVYVMGDSPLVLLSSLQSFFEPDTASSDFVETAAPYITEDGLYDFTKPGRTIRVYTRIDTALMFKDFEDKLRIHAANR